MQQHSCALKQQRIVGRKSHLFWAVAILLLSGCGASWAGAWDGTADLGPVSAYALTLSLSADQSTATWAAPGDAPQQLKICKRQVKGAQLTLDIDIGRPDCTQGKGAKPLQLRGRVGARVIHGSIYQNRERVGFFRAFRSPPKKQDITSG
ncbi:MAG: hypothetical protein KC502_17090 [Myxococcales bacterium]|nr:hypothetical protein [Myxococcales bacterium]